MTPVAPAQPVDDDLAGWLRSRFPTAWGSGAFVVPDPDVSSFIRLDCLPLPGGPRVTVRLFRDEPVLRSAFARVCAQATPTEARTPPRTGPWTDDVGAAGQFLLLDGEQRVVIWTHDRSRLLMTATSPWSAEQLVDWWTQASAPLSTPMADATGTPTGDDGGRATPRM